MQISFGRISKLVRFSLDEFYSWYQYAPELEGKSVSAAAYVEGRFQQLRLLPCAAKKLTFHSFVIDVNEACVYANKCIRCTQGG